MSDIRDGLINDDIKCSCRGFNLDKLLQPRILTLLMQGDLHGYVMIQSLEKQDPFGFDKVDNAGVYRTLKKMESQKLIYSKWIHQESGAAKKIYRISAKGRESLCTWIHTLEQYQQGIERILIKAKTYISGCEEN